MGLNTPLLVTSAIQGLLYIRTDRYSYIVLLWYAEDHAHVQVHAGCNFKMEWRQVNKKTRRDCRKSTGNKLEYWYT